MILSKLNVMHLANPIRMNWALSVLYWNSLTFVGHSQAAEWVTQ